MPLYEYLCSGCEHRFTITQSMKDSKKKKCPECGKHKLERVLGSPHIFVRGEPQTLGHLAERNTKKLGRCELDDRKERDKVDEKKPGKKKLHRELRGMTEEQRKRYIEKGKK